MSDLPPPSGSSVAEMPPPKPASTGPTPFGVAAVVLVVAAALGVLVFAITAGDGDSVADGEVVITSVATEPESAEPVTIAPAPAPAPAPATPATVAVAAPATRASATTAVPATDPGSDAADAETVASPPTSAPVETDPDDSAPTATDETDDESEAPLTDESANPSDDLGYPVLSDGTPLPIEVVYDGATVTLTGLVPSEDARLLLEALAVAGASQPDTVATNLLEINENVPITVGARVLSLDSVRFPEGSSEVTPEHAAELDGTVLTLEALPNATLRVVGHADQRGDDLENLALSQERADSMIFYLVSQGIDPARLSSQGIGESNPLDVGDNDEALDLNRRTELVFFGLLTG